MRLIFVSILVGLLSVTACGGTEEAAPPVPAVVPAPAPAAPGAVAPAVPAVPADDPVVCCEFSGAAGSSTRTLCASFHGTEVPLARCPGM